MKMTQGGDLMKIFHIRHLSDRNLSHLLLLFCSIPHALASVWLGYHLSFIPKEFEITRAISGNPTTIIQQQSMTLWLFFTLIIFLWGFIILNILCECLYRAISLNKAVLDESEDIKDLK